MCVVNFYILGYKTYINIRSSHVIKMIRDARLKKDMSYDQNYSKENFSQLQVRVDIFILYLITIDSYGAHSIETYLNRPENYKQTSLTCLDC